MVDVARSISSASGDGLGRIEPRVWTPPLRDLTPDTSYGYEVIEFAAEVLGTPLDPWQAWLAIHIGELLADGRPRFRRVLVIVARQNGKTYLAQVLTLWWLFVVQVPLVLGTSTDRQYAKEAWRATVALARSCEWLESELGPRAVRETIGEECLSTVWGSRYRFAASNRRAGRSMTVHRLILDELREHGSWDAWNAAYNSMNAVGDGQMIAISNQGDDTSVVLDSLRGAAMLYLARGEGDPRLGLFEWSARPGSDPTDLEALAAANPNLGRRLDAENLMGEATTAAAAGGEQLAGFVTEVLCIRVANLEAAIDAAAWEAAASSSPVDLAAHRDRVALCLDVSLDGTHATLVAAAVLGDTVHVEVVAAWSGWDATDQVRRELADHVERVRPRAVGWFPTGPAAGLATDLAAEGWTPRRCDVEALKAETPSVCMGLEVEVRGGRVVHPSDPLLDAHIAAARRLRRGDRWVFTRDDAAGAVDGAYAVAGAVYLARSLPPPRRPLIAV